MVDEAWIMEHTTPTRVGSGEWGWTIRMPHHRAVRWVLEPDFERARIASMWQHHDPDGILFDIGTEQGDMSALFATWCRDGKGGVVLVEPNDRAWPTVRATFEANGVAPLATFHGFAAAENRIRSDAHPTWPDCSVGAVVAGAGFAHLAEQDDIPAITIDRLAEQVGAPAAITIDVEGAELEVLRGARTVLTEQRPNVWISVHPRFLRHHFGQEPRDVYQFLEDLDYRLWHLADDHEVHIFCEPR